MAVVNGTSPNGEFLQGTRTDDFIYGLGGKDTLQGLGDNDVLNGGFGFDVPMAASDPILQTVRSATVRCGPRSRRPAAHRRTGPLIGACQRHQHSPGPERRQLGTAARPGLGRVALRVRGGGEASGRRAPKAAATSAQRQ